MTTKATVSNLQFGFQTAYIDATHHSNLAYCPEFISNDYKLGKKVLVSIEQELLNCEEFCIGVAFITKGGISPLLMTLKELENRNIPGKILTTDYQTFNDPEALELLASLRNIRLRMFKTSHKIGGFHTKGYIFRKEEIYRIILGSSNITQAALTKNREWNTKLVSLDEGQVALDIIGEFDKLWNADNTFDYDAIKDEYKKQYLKKRLIHKQQKQALAEEIVELERYKLEPNEMQLQFIENVVKMRAEGIEKALLLSSTGTGKTYASAFAMRELEFHRILFLVHRNQIAKQALKSFRNVFGNSVKMGMVFGNHHDYDADFIFATVQTLSKQENLERFAPDYFDCCIYDEAHHTSAGSYKRIMDYFKPKFTLGMTATPDKRDDHIEGRNIYEIFDHNIAYEIRLQQAMEEDLLCPFHYFGITDLETIQDEGTSKLEQLENFRYLTSDERVDYVMKQAAYYGHSGERVKGLIFCSRVEEAKELSRKFNERGLRTIALSGTDSDAAREEAIERLAMGEAPEALDYILSVDIFSEGTDIVECNQVIMLRPTESPIVFIQQLGRGLRKAEGKEYVVILDFIGNYNNNFMIPIALSGDRSYNKDNIRRYVVEGGRIIPGSSTIHFDEISRKRIFASIDNANFSDIKLIKENYANLKNKLGRIPKLMDFDDYGEMDVLRIFDNHSLGSYYKFLVKYEKEYTVRLSEDEAKIIEFVSKKLVSGKRVYELELLNILLKGEQELIKSLQETLKTEYDIQMDQACIDSVINMMTNEFPSGTGKRTYDSCIFVEQVKFDQIAMISELDGAERREAAYEQKFVKTEKDAKYHIAKRFKGMLQNPDFCDILSELVAFGISRYKKNYSNRYQDTDLVLYQKYTYGDVCRLLKWQNEEVPLNIGGYKYDKKTKTFPVFINYDKAEDISDTTKYEDHFTSNHSLIAISKSGRTINSEDVQNFLKAKERGIDVHLFVRKNKEDNGSKEFYYLGKMTASGIAQEFVMTNTEKTAVEIEWILDTPVREDIYEYIVNG